MPFDVSRTGLSIITDPVKLELATMLHDIVIGSTLSFLGERDGAVTIDVFTHLTLSLHSNAVWKANAVTLTGMLSVVGRNYNLITKHFNHRISDPNMSAIITGTCTANIWLYVAMLDVFLSADEVKHIATAVWTEFGVIT